MSCPADRPAPFRCPTIEESVDATVALLPPGRAWPLNDGGATLARYRAWLATVPTPTTTPAGFVQAAYWSAVGAVRNYLDSRLCALREEFWCATQTETRDLWMAEYGLPDACDPFPDLCAKVAAIGGTRCEYYAAIATRAGWSIRCDDIGCQGPRVGGTGALAGRMRAGSSLNAAILRVFVDLDASPAFTGNRFARPLAGHLLAGRSLACGPDLSPLECLLGRVVHAEILILYEVIDVD